MAGYYWCARCEIAVSHADAPTDPRGDMYCPQCGASAAHLMHWGYVRSLHGHFPEAPLSGTLYPRRPDEAAAS